MNKFATDWNKRLCNKMEIHEIFLKELEKELQQLKNDNANDLTNYDHYTVQFSVSKLEESIKCLNEAYLNLKTLLR